MLKWVLSAMLIATSAANADDVDANVERFLRSGGMASLVVKITNNTDTAFRSVYVDCTFMDKDSRALDIGKGSVRNLGANQTVYEKVSIVAVKGIRYASCQTTTFR